MASFARWFRHGVAHAAWHLHPATPAAAYAVLRRTQWWDPDSLLELQLEALRDVLDSAARIEPYRQRLDEAGLKPSGFVRLTHSRESPLFPARS